MTNNATPRRYDPLARLRADDWESAGLIETADYAVILDGCQYAIVSGKTARTMRENGSRAAFRKMS